jgi:hypothetical protein
MISFDEHRAAWRAAVVMQLIGILGLTLDGTFLLTSHHRVLPLYPVAIAILASLLVVLWLDRRRPRKAIAAFADLACVAALIAALWGASDLLAHDARMWVPFQRRKLSVLAIALIAPTPPWVGVLCIAAFTLSAIVQLGTFEPAARAYLAVEEPWAMIAVAAFAFAIILYRTRMLRLEHEAMRAQAEAESLRRLARVALAVRDLSNTPLQTLRLSTELLRRHDSASAARIDQMERALTRLEELERVLVRYEARTQWAPGDESFDPLAVLERPEAGVAAPPQGKRRVTSA